MHALVQSMAAFMPHFSVLLITLATVGSTTSTTAGASRGEASFRGAATPSFIDRTRDRLRASRLR
ncbi:hypothetical protein AKJ09_07987 [Labilithrix luteola]|uniref:Uncharacterized protein n=1 Tax=Labilithrix luteola TaxID=1391654 RepID=A0A0K1Q6I5_9BACT|nr:hypothetical protein AKJ09_07987 [Labilithrix luteola]